MRNLKKSLSLILALALIVSSVFVGGITANAATELYTTLNTYDDTATYPLSNWTYNGSKTVHIGTYTEGAEETTYNNIGMEGVELVNDPLDSEKSNNVLHIIESKATNNAYPASVWVYKQNTNYSHFVPKANTTYEISLRYYVDAIPSQQINLQVRQHTDKRPYNATYKAEDVFVSDFVEITGVTNGWVDAVARFTTGETPSNLYIVSCTLTGSKCCGKENNS